MFWNKKKPSAAPAQTQAHGPEQIAPEPAPTDPGKVAPNKIDALREAIIAEKTRENELRFWEAVLKLPEWHFACDTAAASAAIEQGGMPPMLSLRDEDTRMLAVYTSADRAATAIRAFMPPSPNNDSNDSTKGHPSTVLSIPVPQALAYVCDLAPQIPRVLIDQLPGSHQGFGTDSESLPGMFAHFVATPPLPCLPCMASVAAKTQHPGAYMDCYRVLAQAPHLFTLLSSDKKVAMGQHPEGLYLPLFTNPNDAQQLMDEGGAINQCPPSDLPKIHDLLASSAGDKFIGSILNPSSMALFIKPDWFKQALSPS